MAPRFKSLDEANAWIASKIKEYGGKNKFLSSPEYKEAYPAIRKLHQSVKTKHEQKAEE